MNLLDANNWTSFLQLLEEETCVLMLGPEVPTIKKGDRWQALPARLSEDLTETLDEEGVKYDSEMKHHLSYISQCYLQIPRRKKLNLQYDIKQLINGYPRDINPLYASLAKMPFYIIVTTTPDDSMHRALKQEGKYPIPYNFNFRRSQTFDIDFDQITSETPLVISLFGSVEARQEDSMVLTEEDNMDFIKNIFTGISKIPTGLLKELQYLKAYLFLGFNLDNWQLRLLFDALHLNDETIPLSPRLSDKQFSSVTKAFFANRFNFQFVEQGIPEFIEHLESTFSERNNDQPAEKPAVCCKTFLAYDPKDESYAVKMREFLKPLEGEGLVELLDDTLPGASITADMEEKINQAEVIFILLSASYIASDVLYNEVRVRALARHDGREALVIPVILRPCGWENEIGNIRAVLPSSKIPVSIARNADSAFDGIVRDFRDLLQNWTTR